MKGTESRDTSSKRKAQQAGHQRAYQQGVIAAPLPTLRPAWLTQQTRQPRTLTRKIRFNGLEDPVVMLAQHDASFRRP